MPNLVDAIWVCQAGAAVTVRVEGKGSVRLSPAILRYVESRLAAGGNAIAMDLAGCSHMDSTFLGTLISLHRAAGRAAGSFTITAVSPECATILRHNALDRILNIALPDAPAPGNAPAPGHADAEWTQLPHAATSEDLFRRNVVQAHQELAALPGEAGAPYRKVAAKLTEEMKSDQ